MEERLGPPKYVAHGAGYSGATDDIGEALGWQQVNKQGAVYIRLDLSGVEMEDDLIPIGSDRVLELWEIAYRDAQTSPGFYDVAKANSLYQQALEAEVVAQARRLEAADVLVQAAERILTYGDHYAYKRHEDSPFEQLKAAIAAYRAQE